MKLGFHTKLIYQITAHHTELEIMKKVMRFFNNVGHIEYTPDNKYVSYRVYKTKDNINEIIPHFDCYPLQSTKYVYYALWCKSALLLCNKLHLTDSGFKELLTYKAAFTKKLGTEIFNNKLYNDIIPFDANRLLKSDNIALDPNYIAGFTGADGSFSITKPSLTLK